jgi:hypothetical protein
MPADKKAFFSDFQILSVDFENPQILTNNGHPLSISGDLRN